MKTILIYVTSAILIFGTASAREVNMSPIVTLYRAIVERRVAQLNSADREGGVRPGFQQVDDASLVDVQPLGNFEGGRVGAWRIDGRLGQ